MQYKIEDLRFISPNGDFIFSPEGHMHIDVIHEQNLSNKDGFDAIIDLALSGYVLIAVFNDQILVSHTVCLNDLQKVAVQQLKDNNESFQVTVMQENVA